MIREGSVVSYIGPDGVGGLASGDQGRVLATDYASGAHHVMWSTGARRRQVDAIYENCLADADELRTASRSMDGLDDSLDVGSLVTFSARRTFDVGGPDAILNQMSESGHLASFTGYAEEAITLVSSRIRHDPSFLAVTAELDEDEAEDVFRTVSACLIRQAFTESDEQ